IETVPDTSLWACPDLPAGPHKDKDKPFPPTYAHATIVIGCMLLDADYGLRKLGVIGEGKSERGILEDFSDFVGRQRPLLVTYNGRTFDLPVLALRSLHH